MTSTPKWKIAFHTYFAFYVLSYFIKGIYFATSSTPFFSLQQHPSTSEVWFYAVIGMGLAAVFAALTWYFYELFRKKLDARFEALPPANLRLADRWIPVIGLVLLAYYLYAQRRELSAVLSIVGFLTRRDIMEDPTILNAFVSGDLGVVSLIYQIIAGFMYIFTVYAVLKKNRWLIAVGAIYLLASAILSNGSRFALLSSLLFIPVLWYLLYRRKPSHHRLYVPIIYAAVLILPFLAAFLLVARNPQNLTFDDNFREYVSVAALVSFDQMDMVINYLYLTPIDWTGLQTAEELWQVVPRKVYPDKPFLYGGLALQEEMFPGSVGAGRGVMLYGHYPISNLVAALNLFLPVGLILHAFLTGWFLALLDAGLERRSLLLVSLFMMNIFFLFHLIRVGIWSHLIMGMQSTYIPLFLAWLVMQAGRYRFVVVNREVGNNELRSAT
jgi:hypothetical protein